MTAWRGFDVEAYNARIAGALSATVSGGEYSGTAKSARAAAAFPPPLERDVQAAVLAALEMHPAVGWAARMNTGVLPITDTAGTRHIRFGFKGCSDILGQLTDGRLLSIEVKREGKQLTDDQRAFQETVTRHNGVAFVARCVDDVFANLGGGK